MRACNVKFSAAICLALLLSPPGLRDTVAQQSANFQIVWVIVGEAAADVGSTRAGRQLFKAPDLLALALQDVEVARVQVQPEVSAVAIGERVCMTELRITAFAPDRSPIESAPLSVSIRQEHRHSLNLQRGSDDICFRPSEAGEYPIRVTSLMPAPDGTMRGAQFFLRVREEGDKGMNAIGDRR